MYIHTASILLMHYVYYVLNYAQFLTSFKRRWGHNVFAVSGHLPLINWWPKLRSSQIQKQPVNTFFLLNYLNNYIFTDTWNLCSFMCQTNTFNGRQTYKILLTKDVSSISWIQYFSFTLEKVHTLVVCGGRAWGSCRSPTPPLTSTLWSKEGVAVGS